MNDEEEPEDSQEQPPDSGDEQEAAAEPETSKDDADDEEDAPERVEAKPADEPAAKPAVKRKKKSGKKRKRKKAAPAPTASPTKAAAPERKGISTMGYGLAVATLIVGAAVGWFGRGARAAQSDVDVGPDAVGSAFPAASSGPCGSWQAKICSGAGAQSAACAQARAAMEILPSEACDVAIQKVPATLATLKAKRVTCDKLQEKLCADLGADSQQCTMVKAKTPSIPAAKCKELMDNYDKVLGSLKQAPGGPPGMPPGMHPGMHGLPPGVRVMPPGAVPGKPPGATHPPSPTPAPAPAPAPAKP